MKAVDFKANILFKYLKLTLETQLQGLCVICFKKDVTLKGFIKINT